MTTKAYYNENDPFAAAWLRELIKANLIAPGDVDERSIKEVQAKDLEKYAQCHFFAGIGVWSYALRQAGWPDDRQVWTGSCPCQPFSAAGKGGGFDDARHLWPEWFRLIKESNPNTIFGEQVASKDGLNWFDLVSSDLEGENYSVGACDSCAAGFGAPHIRQRLYFVGNSNNKRSQGRGFSGNGTNKRVIGSSSVVSDAAHYSGIGWRKECSDERRVSSGNSKERLAAGLESSGMSSIMADTNGGNPSAEGIQRSGKYGQQQKDGCSSSPVEHARSEQVGISGCTRQSRSTCAVYNSTDSRHDNKREHSGGSPLFATRSQQPSAVNGFWADAEWIPCIDGKSRPVEPGTFPLASRITNRVGLLRGYGNSLTVPVAQAFIEAYLEVEQECKI